MRKGLPRASENSTEAGRPPFRPHDGMPAAEPVTAPTRNTNDPGTCGLLRPPGQVRRCATWRWTASATPFNSTGPMSENVASASATASTTAWLTSTSPGRAYSADPCGEVHGLAEVVAFLEEHRSGMQADVGGWQPGRSDAGDHLERGRNAGPGVTEMEHHAIAQPLHGTTAVLEGCARDDPAETLGQAGRRLVAPLLRETGVAGDVEEADRGRASHLRPEAGIDEGLLDAADDVRGPRASLLRVPQRQQRPVGHLVEALSLLAGGGRRRIVGRLAGRDEGRQHVRAPGVRLRLREPTEAVARDAEGPLDGERAEAHGEPCLDQRDEGELILADPDRWVPAPLHPWPPG